MLKFDGFNFYFRPLFRTETLSPDVYQKKNLKKNILCPLSMDRIQLVRGCRTIIWRQFTFNY